MKTNPAHLLQFVTIIEEGSFAKAAQSLNISQPALSRNIKLLEFRLGATLMYRDRNGVKLTEIGRLIFGHGQSMKKSYDIASDLAAALSAKKIGQLRLGATPYMADSLLPEPFTEFHKQFDGIHFELISGNASELREKLRSGDLDLAVIPAEILKKSDFIEYEGLIEDRMEILAGSNHPLAKSKKVSISDLAGAKWISHPVGSLLKEQMESSLLSLGISSIDTALQVNSRKILVQIMTNTDVLSVLPSVYFQNEIRAGTMSILRSVKALPDRPIVLAHHSVTPLSSVAKQFKSFLKDWAATHFKISA